MANTTMVVEKKRRQPRKLLRAIDALANISVLDTDPKATLADAVKLAEQALKDIDSDKLFVTLHTNEGSGLIGVTIISAAGNMDIVREVTPHVKALLDGIAEAEHGKPIQWGEPVERHGVEVNGDAP